MAEEIKPCPECFNIKYPTYPKLQKVVLGGREYRQMWTILCYCGKSGQICKTKKEAIKEWNEWVTDSNPQDIG